jgi:2-keto-4-pentenoate hydratase/2-oxohepta-3-ene-1,7-dioic acid hydratase in catechol pathway
VRIANVAGRLTIVPPSVASIVDGGSIEGVDVERASSGRFGADPQQVFPRWEEFESWSRDVDLDRADVTFSAAELGPLAPRPAQVFAIGLNYAAHAAETNVEAPSSPSTFTKFPTCLAGPAASVTLPPGTVDWEVELVVVVGRLARRVGADDAWAHVAGVAVGQDFSERRLQRSGPAPQFSLAKSFPDFGPMGPALVTPDELPDPDDLAIGCSVDGESVQSARTSMMIFGVPALVAHLSSVLPLLPGDVIFTGTPSGVGMGRNPQRFLQAGDVVVSEIEGIGRLRNVMTG